MFHRIIYRVQHKLNKYIFQKHASRLLSTKVENPSLNAESEIDWESIGNELYDIVDVTNHLSNRQKNCLGFANAAINELCELKVALGEKWWSVNSKNWFNTKEGAEFKHIEEEYVDVLHFIISLGHALGITNVDYLVEKYEEKNKENYSRQERGY